MPSLSLSLALDSSSSQSSAVAGIGFPLRLRMFNGATSVNLYRITNTASVVEYLSDNDVYLAYWNFSLNSGAIEENNTEFLGPTLGSVPTNWPTTGWAGGWEFGSASPTLVSLSYASPQSFAFSNSIPSVAFTSSPSINANLFTISGLSSSNVGSQNAVISLSKADYYLAESVTIPVTITKRNVTLSVNNQSATYAPNATYNWFSAVSVATLVAGDTIAGRFNSDLLTGVPATNANAGSYTISFNPNYTSQNYNITNSPASATWTISTASQTISFNPSGTALTTDTTNLSASSTSGLAVSFSVVSGPGSINGSTLTYSGAGNVVVRASQSGNTNYNSATNVDRTIVVSAPAPSGIPVASTASVNIAGVPYMYLSPFTKKTSGYEFNCNSIYNVVINSGLIYMNIDENGANYVIVRPSTIFYKDGYQFYIAASNWKVVSFSDNEGSPEVYDISTNPSTDSTTLPTSGWTPSLTITPA